MLRNEGVPVDDIVGGVIGNQQIQSRVTEVQADGTVVFDVLVTPDHTSSAETYQVAKMDLFNKGLRYQLNEFVRLRKGIVQSSPAISYNLPKFFIPRLDVTFKKLYEKDNHLILQGNFLYQGKEYLLGKLLFVLKNDRNEYVFSAISGLNSNFYATIDLGNLEPGEYAIYVVGGVIEGTDTQGKIKPGYNPTDYKIQVK